MRNLLVSRLGYDQVGSLKAVAAQEPDGALRVVKVVDYDSFGNILADTNPNLFLPLAFAGGLRDRFIGLVRFGCRDYDPAFGRFRDRGRAMTISGWPRTRTAGSPCPCG